MPAVVVTINPILCFILPVIVFAVWKLGLVPIAVEYIRKTLRI